MKRFILPAILLGSPVFADPLNVFVVQEDGGVIEYTGSTTKAEAEVLISDPPPDGTVGIVFDREDGTIEWTSLTGREVNESHGGEGDPYIVNLEDGSGEPEADDTPSEMDFDADEERAVQDGEVPSEMDFDPDEEGATDDGETPSEMDFDPVEESATEGGETPSEMDFDESEEGRTQETETADDPDTEDRTTQDLFPDADTNGKIEPLAGMWIGKVISSSSTGCPPGVAEGVAAQLHAMDGTPVQGTIDASFTPDVAYPGLDWASSGPNSWYADLDQGAGTPVIARVQFALRVMTPERISLRQQINFGGSMMGNCETKTSVDFLRQ